MQIYNNVQSPNFSALYYRNATPEIKRQAMEKINTLTSDIQRKEKPASILAEIDKIKNSAVELINQIKNNWAKSMDGTKHFDIVIGQDLKVKITSDKNAYFGPFDQPGEDKFRGKQGSSAGVVMLGKENKDYYNVSRAVEGDRAAYYVYGIGEAKLDTIDNLSTLTNIAKLLDEVATTHDKEVESVQKAVTAAEKAIENALKTDTLDKN